MYAQKPVAANTILPRLCRWLSFTQPSSRPLIIRSPTATATNAAPVCTTSVKTTTANMVENQWASRDISR